VAQERLFSATTVSRPQSPIVRWIQIQEPKALNRALHFERISLDDVRNPLSGLLGAVGIELDPIAKHIGITGDRLKRHTIADAGIKCRRGLVWEQEKPANPLAFGQWQRVETETTFALESHTKAPFSEN
jgi:hypothetical protein